MTASLGMIGESSFFAAFGRGGRASGSFGDIFKAGDDAIAAGRTAIPEGSIDDLLSKARQAVHGGQPDIVLVELADTVQRARNAGLPDDVIESVLDRARQANPHIEMADIGPVQRELIIERARRSMSGPPRWEIKGSSQSSRLELTYDQQARMLKIEIKPTL